MVLNITLLCNAGLAFRYNDEILLMDLPNGKYGEFYPLPEETRTEILSHVPPYDNVVGIYYTHTHPDHCALDFVAAYREKWPAVPVFLPEEHSEEGQVEMGSFTIEFQRIPHAPIPGAPPMVMTLVRAGERMIYVASDAELDCERHRAFLHGRRADAAFWNSMYLSKEDTRKLLQDTAKKNYIYHMPVDHEDHTGFWRKCRANFRRNGDQLTHVEVLGAYPSCIELP